jgi:predicted N-formylglutamate amidohydrolase
VSAAWRLIVSCEHAGNAVPPEYAIHFAGHEDLLATHRGWDPGALELGQEMAAATGASFFYSTTTRLLADLNRSVGHPQLFSEATRSLSRTVREAIIARHYRPHRGAVEGAVAEAIAAGERVIHIASHSFTPVMQGVARSADVAWLYDSRRPAERAFAVRWQTTLAAARPELRLRRNYPYQGKGDGLTTLLRKRHPADSYIGIELEVNQRFVDEGGRCWDALRGAVIGALKQVLQQQPD